MFIHELASLSTPTEIQDSFIISSEELNSWLNIYHITADVLREIKFVAKHVYHITVDVLCCSKRLYWQTLSEIPPISETC